jgi:hypothetical protein
MFTESVIVAAVAIRGAGDESSAVGISGLFNTCKPDVYLPMD